MNFETNTSPIRLLWLSERLHHKAMMLPMVRPSVREVDLVLSGNRYVQRVQLVSGGLGSIVFLSTRSFHMFGAADVTNIRRATGDPDD